MTSLFTLNGIAYRIVYALSPLRGQKGHFLLSPPSSSILVKSSLQMTVIEIPAVKTSYASGLR